MSLAHEIDATIRDYETLTLAFEAAPGFTAGEFVLASDEFTAVQATLSALIDFHRTGIYGPCAAAIEAMQDHPLVMEWISDYGQEEEEDGHEGQEGRPAGDPA